MTSRIPPLPLIRALRDEDAAVRICATRSLGKCGEAIAVPALVSAVRDERVPSGIVAEALVALGSVVEFPMVQATRADSPRLRRLAVDVVGALRLAGARRAVIGLLEDPDRSVRVGAARALGRIGWPDVAGELAMRCLEEEALLRLAAVESIVQLEAPEGVPVLTAAMGDPEHLVAHRAAQGLARWAELARGEIPLARASYGVLTSISELDTRAGEYAREAIALLDVTEFEAS